MFELLHQKITENIALSEEEFAFCKSQFQPKKLKKKRFLLGEDEVCKHIAFVEKGLLRSYIIDEKGSEHILQFSLEGWWVSDMASYLTGEPAQYNIEALEDCELLLISKPSWELLLEKIPAFERYFRILVENNLIVTQRRLIASFSDTAEEKYQKLIQKFPLILQRVPLHMIASYLGITRETLSRVRSQLTDKK
ncbi:MAG: Crp/Fnr family transcriptional regulator [Bacteroidetes bacterium]|nr:Crp/Fnr family transcriptional regulator [Bacteroidota bacterium]